MLDYFIPFLFRNDMKRRLVMADPSQSDGTNQQQGTPRDVSVANEADLVQRQIESQQQANEFPSLGHNARKMETREDRIINEYREFVRNVKILVTKELGKDASAEELDKHCFPCSGPESFEDLCDLLMHFLNDIAGNIASDLLPTESPSFRSLKIYMDTLERRMVDLYQQHYGRKRSSETLDAKKLGERLNMCCTYLVHKYGLTAIHDPEKTYLGLAEIALLIDNDLSTTKSIELAECHHLAWTLGVICAIRPNSLGPDERKTENCNTGLRYLTFRDCQIQREPGGRFVLKLQVRNLRTLHFTVRTPQRVEDFCLSPVFRILVIALRRGALEKCSSLEELLSNPEADVIFKDEFLDKPIMLRSTKGGLGVTSDPPRSGAFTNYVSRQAIQAGFLDKVTFTSIRRKTASHWYRTFGSDTTRVLLGHKLGSEACEEQHVNIVQSIDVSLAGFNQSSNGSSLVINDNVLLEERLSPVQLQEAYGTKIPQLFRKMKREQLDHPQGLGGTRQKRTLDTVLKTRATFEVMKQVKEEHMENLKHREVMHRRETVLNCETAFNKKLLDIAREHGWVPEEPESSGRVTQVDGACRRTSLYESSLAHPKHDSVFLNELNRMSYEAATFIVLKMMLENPLSQVILRENGQCPLCLTDPTVSQKESGGTWCKDVLRHATRYKSLGLDDSDDDFEVVSDDDNDVYDAEDNDFVSGDGR